MSSVYAKVEGQASTSADRLATTEASGVPAELPSPAMKWEAPGATPEAYPDRGGPLVGAGCTEERRPGGQSETRGGSSRRVDPSRPSFGLALELWARGRLTGASPQPSWRDADRDAGWGDRRRGWHLSIDKAIARAYEGLHEPDRGRWLIGRESWNRLRLVPADGIRLATASRSCSGGHLLLRGIGHYRRHPGPRCHSGHRASRRHRHARGQGHRECAGR
jgi:hypothetical protein